MRTVAGFAILIYIIHTTVDLISHAFNAQAHGLTVFFLMALPSALSMLIALVFASDKIYFRKLNMGRMKTFTVCAALFALTLLFYLAGNRFTDKVNTITLIPETLVYAIFPLSVLLTDRLGAKNV